MQKDLTINQVKTCFDAGAGRGESCGRPNPRPGMLLSAAAELGIDLPPSFMNGDRWRDIDCGAVPVCKAIFIDRHYHEALKEQLDYRVRNLLEAAKLIEP